MDLLVPGYFQGPLYFRCITGFWKSWDTRSGTTHIRVYSFQRLGQDNALLCYPFTHISITPSLTISHSASPDSALLEDVASQDLVAVDDHIGSVLYMNSELGCRQCVMVEMCPLQYRTGCLVVTARSMQYISACFPPALLRWIYS